jgi:hypothetical protein
MARSKLRADAATHGAPRGPIIDRVAIGRPSPAPPIGGHKEYDAAPVRAGRPPDGVGRPE